ncbi:MAG: DNA-binding protein [Nitrososphaerales archaeon]
MSESQPNIESKPNPITSNSIGTSESTMNGKSGGTPPNHVYIGKKPVMSYAMSALIQLAQTGEIVIKARGMVISRAVDVAEVVVQRLGGGSYETKDIKIDTERLGEGSEARNVSTIEIVVGKKP